MTAPHLITPMDWALEALNRAASDGADLHEAQAARVESNRFRACAERIAELMTERDAALADADRLRASYCALSMQLAHRGAQAERAIAEASDLRALLAEALAGQDDQRAEVERLRALLCEIDRQLGHDDRDDAIREQITETLSGPDDLRAEAERWRTKVGAVMPADFKCWHQNSPAEWPEVTAHTITALRADRDAVYAEAARLRAELARYREDEA